MMIVLDTPLGIYCQIKNNSLIVSLKLIRMIVTQEHNS